MEKLYEQKPDIKEFGGVVVTCQTGKNGLYYVTLDRTAFYPEGGGQPFDTGILEEIGEREGTKESGTREPAAGEKTVSGKQAAKVVEVHEKDGQILHYVDRKLSSGSRVRGVIDWERRQRHMRHHTGEHIFSGLVHSHYGYDNVGFHMGQDGVTIDFNGMLTMDQVLELEKEANRLAWADLMVEAWYPSPEELHSLDYRSKKEIQGPVRVVRIPGGDTCACRGTHVSRTGEIGMIKVTGLKKYKSGVRLEMVCGFKALEDYEKKQEQVMGISNLLSAKQGEVALAVEKLLEESAARNRQINQMYQRIFRLRCQQLPKRKAPLLIFEEDCPPAQLRLLVTQLCQEGKGEPVLACSGHDGEYYYVLGSGEENAVRFAGKLNHCLGGKGSGRGLMAQGLFCAAKDEIQRVWDEGLWKE